MPGASGNADGGGTERRARGEQRGEQKGELKKAKLTTGKLYAMGLDVEKIAEAVDYPVETIKEWLGLE